MPQVDIIKDKEFVVAIGNFINLINGWILGSIDETYRATKHHENNSSPLVAFILISTTIDFIAGFLEGLTDLNNPGNSANIYKEYVKRYMSNYDPDKLYKDLRCRLAHNFTIGPAYALIHKRYDLHNRTVPVTGQTIINFENFRIEFEESIKKYVTDLEHDVTLRSKFMRRYKLGVPAIFQIKGEIY